MVDVLFVLQDTIAIAYTFSSAAQCYLAVLLGRHRVVLFDEPWTKRARASTDKKGCTIGDHTLNSTDNESNESIERKVIILYFVRAHNGVRCVSFASLF